MIRTAFAVSVACLISNAGSQPAAADFFGAPWCAVISMGDGDMQWDCEFRSVAECVPHVLSGNRGWCNPNPYLAYSSVPTEKARRQRKRHVRAQ